jgi:hypothetical protein
MDRSYLLFHAGFVLAFVAMPVPAADVNRIDITCLVKHNVSYVGKRVSTHGCLVFTEHAEFIEPCNHGDRPLVLLVDDPLTAGISAFRNLQINFSKHVEGDFSGVMIRRYDDTGLVPGKRVFLKLGAVANGAPHEP